MCRTTKLRVLSLLLLLLLLLNKKLLEVPIMLTSYWRLISSPIWMPYLPLRTSREAVDLIRAPEATHKWIQLRLMILLLEGLVVLELLFKQERLGLRCVLMIWL